GRSKELHGPQSGPKSSAPLRDEMMDVAIRLQPADRLDLYRAVSADAAQVVAQQIDDHDVLGAVLGAGEQLAAAGLVLLGGGAARSRPLDGPRLHVAVVHFPQPLRRGAGNDEVAEVEVASERRRVAFT